MARARTIVVVAVLAAVPVAGQPPVPAPEPPPVVRPGLAGFPNSPSDGHVRPVNPHRTMAPSPAGPRKLDRHGDPLPAGAVARFGSVRLRHGGLSGLGFTADGRYLVSISSTEDGFRMWEPATGKEVARLATPVQTAALAPDRSVVFAADGKLRVWEPLAAGRLRAFPPTTLPDAGVSALAVQPGGRLFAAAVPAGNEAAGIALVDLVTGERKGNLKVPGDQPPIRIVFSPDGRWVAGAGPRTGVWLWNLATNRRVRTYPIQGDHLDFAFSQDGTRLAVAGAPLALYHTDSEEPVEGFIAPETPAFAARFSADGRSLFVLRENGALVRLDTSTGEEKEAWAAPDGVAAQPPLALAANAAWVAAADDTGGIRVWNPKDGTGPEVERLTTLIDPGFSSDSKTASALTADGKVVTFDPATGAPGKVFDTGLGGEGGVAWDARAGLAVGLGKTGDEAELHVLDVARNKVVAKLPVQAGDMPFVAFSPTHPDRLGLFGLGSVMVIDARTGRRVRAFDVGRNDTPRSGALSTDGRLVAVTTSPVSVWEVATGKMRVEFPGPAEPLGVTFSANGKRLAVADGSEVVVHDLRTNRVVRRIRAPCNEPLFTGVSFAPDGTRIATGGADGVVTLWDVESGEALVAFDRHEGPVTGATFSADGARLLSASLDGTALIWDAAARPAAPAPPAGPDEAFGLLASPDPAVAHRGIISLLRTPDATTKLLSEKIAVPTAVPIDRLTRLVADLGSPEFPTRQAAVKALNEVGAEAGPALEAAVRSSPTPEVRRVAGEILNRLAAPLTNPDDLRAIRAVEVLECLETTAAREVLTKWAGGPTHHRLTTEAAAALRRVPGRR